MGWGVAAVAAFILVGCSKVNQESYDKLSIGMAYSEVTTVLGEPSTCESVLSAKSCRWGDQKSHIDLKIVADKVVFKSSEGL